MTKEQYLEMCESLGTEPSIEEIPLEYTDFPPALQIVLELFGFLPDRWEGMSGTYMGKDYTLFPYLAEIYGVEDPKFTLLMLSVLEKEYSKVINKEQEIKKEQKKASKAAKSPRGKAIGTHNLSGIPKATN
jgi:hypothetical protein